MRFREYNSTIEVPNVVVDGSPNAATVLTLTHWPGIAQPPGLAADLSAQMAFRFIRRGDDPGAEVVTNNHFDQDGLVAMLALVDPDSAIEHEALLTDVAAAGDFATYRHRQAARASMAIWTYAHPERSPLAAHLVGPYEEQCAVLYEAMLELVIPIAVEPERFRDLWAEEDAQLVASEAAFDAGAIIIEERADIDLAVVKIGDAEPSRGGHRFASDAFAGVHPMAVNNATTCLRLLLVHGNRYSYVDRYESWVQYQSRRPLPRVDLRPLAERFNSLEPGMTTWTASAPSALTPSLQSSDESGLAPTLVVGHLMTHLESADPAWDPYAV